MGKDFLYVPFVVASRWRITYHDINSSGRLGLIPVDAAQQHVIRARRVRGFSSILHARGQRGSEVGRSPRQSTAC
jgi:hypothetical protein